jgi:sulfonate transport system substrate-binding protein
MISKSIQTAAACAAMLLSALTAATAAPVKIRVGWVVTPANLTPILFAKDGIARHNGKSYVLLPSYFAGSSTEITGLQAGELDIAALGFSTLPIAVQNGGLTDLRIIADEVQDGASDGFSVQFMVRNASSIKTVVDLKGKVLATIGRGSGVHIGMLAMLKKAGLQENRDYTLIESPYPTMKGLLKDGKADLIAVTTGFANDPELKAMARTLFTQKDSMGASALSFWAARSEFISKNRPVLVDFIEDTLRANRWYMDPANRQEAVAIVAGTLKRPPEQLDKWVFKSGEDFYRNPNLMPDIAALQKNIDLLKELGVIRASIDAKQHSDFGPLQEAIARLNK